MNRFFSIIILLVAVFAISWLALPSASPTRNSENGSNSQSGEQAIGALLVKDAANHSGPNSHQLVSRRSTESGKESKGEGSKETGEVKKQIASQTQAIRALDGIDIPEGCLIDLPGLDFDNHRDELVKVFTAIKKHNQKTQAANPQRQSSTRQSQPSREAEFVELPNAPRPISSSSLPTVLHNRNRDPNSTFTSQDNHGGMNVQATKEMPKADPVQQIKQQLEQAIYRDPQVSLANYNPHTNSQPERNEAYRKAAANPNVDPHLSVFSKTAFPSATECKTCHEQIYREWSVSSHAYASISPMFHKFEQRINDLAQGTIGYFCMRCHAPVATTLELRRDQPIWDGPRVFREGVTCVACHRVKQAHGEDNGERRMEPGPINAPVYGTSDGLGVEKAKRLSEYLKVKTDPRDKRPGQLIHRRAIKFDQLSKSTFCVSCHQVAVEPGIALEVVWNQYRASPAWRNGTTCQDCHMGRVPGKDEGYSIGPAAIIDGKAVNQDRKHSNHQFFGPGYSIAHPGIFPQNPAADRWTVNEWLQFDWRSGWGTEAFEDALDEGKVVCGFPPAWSDVDDRMDAREIIDANFKLLKYKRDMRRQVMENGSKIEGPFFAKAPQSGKPLLFHYNVKNISTGHNMPSGSLGAQPQLWLNVVLIGPAGNRVWESGYLDSIGDLADLHSDDVNNKRIPLDSQLFNLQTKFLTTNVKGTDREMYLPINVDFDQLPFIRPDARPNTVMNHPPFIRMEGHSIAATGQRKAKYKIPANLMVEPGCYRLSVRLRSRAEPIYFMKDVGATKEMIQAMNEGILDIHPYSKTFIVR